MSRTNVDILLDDLGRLDDGHGPAEPIDAAWADALVLGAMGRSGIVTAEHHAGARRSGRGVWIRRSALLGAGVVALTTAAAAFMAGVGRESLASWIGSPAPTRHAKLGARSAMPVDPIPTGSPQAAAPEPATTSVPSESTGEPAPTTRARPASTPTSAPRHGLSSDDAQRAVPQAGLSPAVTSAPQAEPAVDLLAQANQYRRQRQYRHALQAYLDVAERYPNTRQAEAARVAAADLRLGHLSDAKGAAEQYRAAASGEGQLAEEAAYGLAEAHRAAGRYDLERAELERFVARYPASPFAATARRRLGQLNNHGR